MEKKFQFNPDKIGGIKFESGKTCANHRVMQRENEPFEVKELTVYPIPIFNEWDQEEFQETFDEMPSNRVLIKGTAPGVGKTTCVKNYNKKGKKLFVTPFNKLAQQTRMSGQDAITLNTLLGIYGDGKKYAKIKPYDITNYECICFDEIMINPPHILQQIDYFMKQNPEKFFFATGDVDQLQPIQCYANNVQNSPLYLSECIDQMFPSQITLTINKRLKRQLKDDIFDEKQDIMKVMKKYGFRIITKYSDLKSTNNISYFNFRAKNVSVHTNLVQQPKKTVSINKTKYWPGLELRAKNIIKQKMIDYS